MRIEFELSLDNSQSNSPASAPETWKYLAQELYVVVRLPLYQAGKPPDLENPPGDR